MNKKSRKKLSVDKYNLGSFVTANQQGIVGAGTMIGGAIGGGAGSALSGAAAGAGIGAIGGPIGMGIGAAVGLVGGLLGNKKRKRAEAAQKLAIQNQELGEYANDFNSNIDTINENPYGVYKNGGEVLGLAEINVELGELQIDPTSGKILREFKGINPETGGKYEPHAKGKKKDTKDNLVTAEEGTFIITKAKAKDYKDALDNNDKLFQNSILQNIRNKKKLETKFATGGSVGLPPIGIETNPYIYTREDLGFSTPVQHTGTTIPYTKEINNPYTLPQNNTNTNKGLDVLMNYGPAAINLLQGAKSPNYMSRVNTPQNNFRGQALGNMPQEINYTPLFNRMYNDRNTAFNQIDNTTSSSAIGRANKANVTANTQRGIQEAFFTGEGMNNQIRGQRASMFNQFGEADRAASFNTSQFNSNIDMTNRQMDLAKTQQRNYGLSQIQQMYQNNRTNSQLKDRDAMRERMLAEIFPALGPYLSKILGGQNGE